MKGRDTIAKQRESLFEYTPREKGARVRVDKKLYEASENVEAKQWLDSRISEITGHVGGWRQATHIINKSVKQQVRG